jgi:hypothetical protein
MQIDALQYFLVGDRIALGAVLSALRISAL